MNKCTIIGNLTADPEMRTTPNGKTVATFTVAVNRRFKEGENAVNYFRVTAWNQLGEICCKYLSKGRKAAVVGEVSVNAYIGKDGAAHASLELTADEVEFLSSRADAAQQPAQQPAQQQTQQPAQQGYQRGMLPDFAKSGFTEINDSDLPWA